MSVVPVPERPPRPGLSMLKCFALAGVTIFLLAGVATATAALLEVKSVVDIIRSGHTIPGIDNVLDSVDGGGPQTILVLGSDRRFIDAQRHDPVRSDTIMLIRLDPNNAATALMSIPRDLEVNSIPGYPGTYKINAAYAFGGPKLAVKVIRNLFHVPINHVVNVNFGGFQRAVNKLGCVYVDVDRRYFHSNVGVPIGQRWAAINIQPGYQRLCGSDSLAYVRYRHTDSDEVRAARQQSFMRQAKAQFGLGKLFGSRDELLHIFARYTQTDVRSETAILRLLKLAFESAGHPVRSVQLNEQFLSDGNVGISPGDIAAASTSFMKAQAVGSPQTGPSRATTAKKRSSSHASHHSTHQSYTLAPGLIAVQREMEDYVADAATRTQFPLYYPRARLGTGSLASDPPRVYGIRDRGGKLYRAYRIVMSTGEVGQYYGVQGMTWTAPPILDSPTLTRTIGGRKYDLFYDGSHLQVVAYRRPHAVYWVSNSLSEKLSNRQMLGIARSLHRIGS